MYRIDAFDCDELADIIRKNFPPAGWYRDVAIREVGEDEWEVNMSAPLTPGSWVRWEPEWRVFQVKNDLQNVPGYPEEFGDTPTEALETLCEQIAEQFCDQMREGN